jgi:serine protease Do
MVFWPRIREGASGQDAVTFMRVIELLWRKEACWLLAGALMLGVLLADEWRPPASSLPATKSPVRAPRGDQPDKNSGSRAPGAPKPTPARRQDLASAFSKATPVSIADLKAMEQHVKALVPRVSPAVVAVEVGSGSGSGVVISADGLVLSAGHICGRPGRDVRFRFADGRTARGKTLGVDREGDTGLMRITDRGPWRCVGTGDLDEARAGDWVLALGHPGGFDLKRSLVVRLGRVIRVTPGALQTDCTISPGDSGGPLFDMHGRVIGIHSYISTSMAENFHVPITRYYEDWDGLAAGKDLGANPEDSDTTDKPNEP